MVAVVGVVESRVGSADASRAGSEASAGSTGSITTVSQAVSSRRREAKGKKAAETARESERAKPTRPVFPFHRDSARTHARTRHSTLDSSYTLAVRW